MNRKLTIILLFGLFVPELAAAESLTIPADSEYLIEASQQTLHLDSLTIGDNAIITFADDVTSWSLNVNSAKIGNNVLIDGRGADGAPGSHGKSWDQPKPECGDGHNGENGLNGGAGTSGRNLTINLGLARLGGLTIDASGGKGGNGGDGGTGEAAGFGKTCLRAAGGNGGNGGKGGNGGDGGELRVSVWSAVKNGDINTLLQRMSTRAEFGEAGVGGESGIAGAGSPSQVSNIPSVTGGRRRLHAGDNGEDGKAGSGGRRGVNGTVSITTAMSSDNYPNDPPASETTKPSSSMTGQRNSGPIQSDRDKEIEQLRQQVEALQQRLEQLENQQ